MGTQIWLDGQRRFKSYREKTMLRYRNWRLTAIALHTTKGKEVGAENQMTRVLMRATSPSKTAADDNDPSDFCVERARGFGGEGKTSAKEYQH